MMIKRSLALLALIVFVNDLNSQEHAINIDSTTYHHWAKRGVVEATYAYMKDYAQRDKPLRQSEEDALNRYDIEFLKTNRAISDDDLDKISSFLKNNSWPSTNKKIFNVLRKRYDNNRPLGKSFFDLPRIDSTYSNWNKKVKEIISGYAESTSEAIDDKIKVPKSTPRTSITDTNNRNQDVQDSRSDTNGGNYFLHITMLLFGILIGVIIIKRRIKSQVFSILNNEDYENSRSLNQKKYNPNLGLIEGIKTFRKRKENYKTSSETLEKKVEKLKYEIETLEEKNKETNNENTRLKNQVNLNKTESISFQVTENDKVESENISEVKREQITSIFFSIPDNNGSFNINNSENFDDGRKYYKVDYEKDSDKGSILFVSSNKDKRAIREFETFLESVCDIENPEEADVASKVEVLKTGIVNFIDGRWVIDKNNKIKVKLC